VPGRLSPEEADLYRRLSDELAGLSGPDFMRTFMQLQLRPGVELAPPVGSPPPWLRSRPAGLAAMMAAFGRHPFDREQLRRCDLSVLLAYGDLTGEHEAIRAGVLARLLPDLHVRRFAGVHHFVPPTAIYTEDHVRLLRDLWTAGGDGR
jgi:hypothetical protein